MNKTIKTRNRALAIPVATMKKKELDSKNTPAFQSRKTIADYVRENMQKAGRKTFFQRVILVTANQEDLEFEDLKSKIDEIVDHCNHNLNHEIISGVYIFYKNYSVLMIEGSEQSVAKFTQSLSNIEEEIYSEAKVLLVQNNINRVYFDHLVWITESPPSSKDEIDKQDEEEAQKLQCDFLIQKMHSFCTSLAHRSSTQNQIIDDLPEIPRIEVVLKCASLLTISQFSNMYLQLTDVKDNDERVWPLPYDYTPYGIFSVSKYNVNLTFSDPEPNK